MHIDFTSNTSYDLILKFPEKKRVLLGQLLTDTRGRFIQISYDLQQECSFLYSDCKWLQIQGYIVNNNQKFQINFINCTYKWPWRISFHFCIVAQQPLPRLKQMHSFHQITFSINGLNNWFVKNQKGPDVLLDTLLDSKQRPTLSYAKAKYFVIENKTQKSSYEIIYKNKKYKLLISTEHAPLPADNALLIKYRTGITLKSDSLTNFTYFKELAIAFKELIQIICNANLVLTNTTLQTNSEYYDVFPSTETDVHNWIYPSQYYQEIRASFGKYFNKWLVLRTHMPLLIQAIHSYQQMSAFTVHVFLQQIQALESFGNMQELGRNTKGDILASILSVDQQDFQNIFHVRPLFQHRGYIYFGKRLTQELLANQLMKLRNFYIHPFINGHRKKPAEAYISPLFLTKDKRIDDRRIKYLSARLHQFLIFLLHKQVGLRY